MENLFGLSDFGSSDPKSFFSTKWGGMSLSDQGFKSLTLPLTQRKNVNLSEYNVFKDEKHYKTVEAETAAKALQACDVDSPYKIEHNNCRIGTIIKLDSLEYVSNKGTLDDIWIECEEEKEPIQSLAQPQQNKPEDEISEVKSESSAEPEQPVAEDAPEVAPDANPQPEQPAAE